MDCVTGSRRAASPSSGQAAPLKARCGAAVVLFILLASPRADANPASDALRLRAATDFYNQDNERAALIYRQAIAADPEDPAASRGLASTLWTSITASRGMLTVDAYLGGASRPNMRFPPPPAEIARGFDDAVGRAIALSRPRGGAD